MALCALLTARRMTLDVIKSSRLVFARFDEQFLEKSWEWLRDPEMKTLVMSPDFTREEQLQWFSRLPGKSDYLIWGLSCDGAPVGAAGLKHVTKEAAEYWGYIGERQYWGIGLGREAMNFVVDQARKLGLHELYLNVHEDNIRAVQLYTKFGFSTVSATGRVLKMQMLLQKPKKVIPQGLTVERYHPDRKAEWDAFLVSAKNATFLFNRDYIDYNLERFPDHSLMVFQDGKLLGLLPASRAPDGALVSHPGLTYGGLVVNRSATLRDVMACFHTLLRHLYEQKISRLLYKEIPTFYNPLPSDEAAYALFLVDAHLHRRDSAVVLPMADRLPFQSRRKRQIKRATQSNVRMVQETSFVPFWERVLAPRLASRFGVKPVHSVEQITLLASRFPENIKQFSAYDGDAIAAGITIYETPTVAHAQYIAMTDEKAKESGRVGRFGGLAH